MRLGVFGRPTDPLSVHTAAVARARGLDVIEIAFSELAHGTPAAFDGSSWLWAGEQLESCDAFVVRRYPAATAQLGPPEESLTQAEWWKRAMHQNERSSFAQSAIIDLELRAKPIVNPLAATAPFEHKPLQLAAFERAGLPIPKTLVTNWPDAVRILEEETPRLIVKPVAGGAETLAVDDAVKARLAAIAEAPVIVQERVDGPDVRVTVVGGRVVSSVVIASDTLDYRGGASYRSGDAKYEAHALSADGERIAIAAASTCRHVLSGVDLKLRSDGSYALLEANSAPVYLDIELKTGVAITDAVIDWLVSRVG
jgi:glutathione synthase/RimK-type ligase-like ATP-grasp enzyme